MSTYQCSVLSGTLFFISHSQRRLRISRLLKLAHHWANTVNFCLIFWCQDLTGIIRTKQLLMTMVVAITNEEMTIKNSIKRENRLFKKLRIRGPLELSVPQIH